MLSMRNTDRTTWLSQTDGQKWDSSHQETFFQSSTVKFGDPVQIAALVSRHLVWYSAAVVCLVQGFNMLYVQRCYSEDLDWLFELLLPSDDL